ncbi:metal-dependent hydrolase [Caminicella sporogenes]|uniref:metal-dependent hydrolase n=1 Tax=Caminicella sporogenes TaxID=166485 RepID=UPI002540DB64|nr:metal-dependent hydrolase [Caminicella sporogenes]WIF95721.1 metal-dependent hydrolase [Caminicella sporogenes]
MMGKTHFKIGILYYLLMSFLTGKILISFYHMKIDVLALLAAGIGAVFPDADSDHSMVNTKNPLFKASKKTINYFNRLIKKVIGFFFFIVPAVLIILYMYKNKVYLKELVILEIILLFLSFNSIKVGKYIPLLSSIYRKIDNKSLKIKKIFMMSIYIYMSLSIIYFSRGRIIGVIWGAIFMIIAVFPHRTFLHAPEGLILSVIGVKYLADILNVSYITLPFAIGYFSHLYLGDVFTSSGVPVSSLPVILKKMGLHERLKKYTLYKNLYKILNIRLKIPIIKTGSTLGNVFEWLYVLVLFILIISIYSKY